MFKHKIIYKDLKVRERLRQEKGLERQFTTYSLPQTSESTQTLSDLEEVSPFPDWCIIQEQNDWEIEEFLNGSSYYEMDNCEEDHEISFQKKNKMGDINAEYMEKMGLLVEGEGTRSDRVRFQALFRVKSFFQEEEVFQISELEQRLEKVNFKDQ